MRNAQRVHGGSSGPAGATRHQLLLSDGGSAEPGAVAAPAVNILPSRQNLNWAFEQWLAKQARAGDMVVFYFAGESRCVAKSQGTQLDVRHYLLPEDADPAKPEQTGWLLEEAVDECVRNKLRVVCWLATAPVDAPARGPRPRRLRGRGRMPGRRVVGGGRLAVAAGALARGDGLAGLRSSACRRRPGRPRTRGTCSPRHCWRPSALRFR